MPAPAETAPISPEKKPRGRPKSAFPRVVSVQVSLSPEEWLALDGYAARAGYGAPRLRVARLLRGVALDRVRSAREQNALRRASESSSDESDE